MQCDKAKAKNMPCITVVKHLKLSFQWSGENMSTHSPTFVSLNSMDSFCQMHTDLQDSWMGPELHFLQSSDKFYPDH